MIITFLSINGLKGYFEEDDHEKNIILGPKEIKYLTLIFTIEYQKFMYKEIFKKLVKIFIEITLKLNLNQETMCPYIF